jgi:hypothetical protein
MAAWLDEDDLNNAFGSLISLKDPWPITAIRDIIQQYSRNCIGSGRCLLAIEAWQRLADTLTRDPAKDPSARIWVAHELTTLGGQLRRQNNLACARVAFRAAIDLNPEG